MKHLNARPAAQQGKNDSVPLVDAVRHALHILELFSEIRIELSLEQLSAALDLNPKRTRGLCQSLTEAGYLTEITEDIYRLGHKLRTMGRIYERSNPYRSLVHLYMKELTATTGQTTALYVMDRGHGLCIASEHLAGHSQLVYMIKIGDEAALLPTAAGRILLAYSEPELINEYLHEAISSQPRHRQAQEFDQLQHELVSIRQKGVALSNQEESDGICSIAIPILNKSRKLLAALALIGPAHNFKGEGEKLLRERIMYTNLKIKQLMGN